MLQGIGVIVFALATFFWLGICIIQYPFYDTTMKIESYIFSIFFFILALLMIGGTIALNCIMQLHFKSKIKERWHFLCVFITIACIIMLQTFWFLIYYAVIYDPTLDVYKRYLIENYTNLLWDIPTLLLVCNLHRKTFVEGEESSTIKSRVSIMTSVTEPLVIEEERRNQSIQNSPGGGNRLEFSSPVNNSD